MAKKFKLSRKRKKQFKKDCYPFFNAYYNSDVRKENWEWFYFKERVEIRGMSVIVDNVEKWYNDNYPDNKQVKHYLNQNLKKW